ncbi:MAG: hypothetical protein KIT58_11635, partial [Planctomycetota bacterium]|nr:hypothetical protein [Planctomycetota bacterium]
GPAWGPGLTPEEQAMSRIAAQLYREILVSVVHDAVSAEERFVEELEDGREWNADQVASSAVRAVLNVLAVRGVPVTTDMVLAGMTPGMLTSSIVDALREAALRRAWPDLERGARRQAAKAAKAERRKKSEDARKARKAARRRRRRS